MAEVRAIGENQTQGVSEFEIFILIRQHRCCSLATTKIGLGIALYERTVRIVIVT